MSKIGDNKILTLPTSTDLVSLEAITGALQDLEDCAAHGIAVQSNTSTKAYATNVPFQSYYDGMRLQFIARYANTGAATLNINGKGAKKLLNADGVQLSAPGAIQAYSVWWIEYDSTLDGGAGAFKCMLLTDDGNNVKLTGDQFIAGTKAFVCPIHLPDAGVPIISRTFLITRWGGVATRMINCTGGDVPMGTMVKASTTTPLGFVLGDNLSPIGYCFGPTEDTEDGGDYFWIVVSGITPMLVAPGESAIMGQYVDVSSVPGKVKSSSDTRSRLGIWLENGVAGSASLGLIQPTIY